MPSVARWVSLVCAAPTMRRAFCMKLGISKNFSSGETAAPSALRHHTHTHAAEHSAGTAQLTLDSRV